MRAPRKPRLPKPLPHKIGGPAPVIGPAIMAFVAANPGTNPHTVHAAIGGSLVSVQTLMSNYKMLGTLHARGTKYFRVYYTTLEAAGADVVTPSRARSLGYKYGGIKNRVLVAMKSRPGGASPAQMMAATGLTRGQVSDALCAMTTSGQICAIARYQIRVYFTSHDLMEAARSDVMAAWAAEAQMYRERKHARQRATAAKYYALHGPRVPKPKVERVVKVKVERVPKPAKVKAVKVPKPPRVPAVPKPKKPAALVSVKTPISAKPKPMATRKGWGRDDPMNITADTIVTVYRSVYVPMPTNSRQFQHGHSGKFAP